MYSLETLITDNYDLLMFVLLFRSASRRLLYNWVVSANVEVEIKLSDNKVTFHCDYTKENIER